MKSRFFNSASGVFILATMFCAQNSLSTESVVVQPEKPFALIAKPLAESLVLSSTGEKLGYMQLPLARSRSGGGVGSDPIGFILGGDIDGQSSGSSGSYIDLGKILKKRKELEATHKTKIIPLMEGIYVNFYKASVDTMPVVFPGVATEYSSGKSSKDKFLLLGGIPIAKGWSTSNEYKVFQSYDFLLASNPKLKEIEDKLGRKLEVTGHTFEDLKHIRAEYDSNQLIAISENALNQSEKDLIKRCQEEIAALVKERNKKGLKVILQFVPVMDSFVSYPEFPDSMTLGESFQTTRSNVSRPDFSGKNKNAIGAFLSNEGKLLEGAGVMYASVGLSEEKGCSLPDAAEIDKVLLQISELKDKETQDIKDKIESLKKKLDDDSETSNH